MANSGLKHVRKHHAKSDTDAAAHAAKVSTHDRLEFFVDLLLVLENKTTIERTFDVFLSTNSQSEVNANWVTHYL